MSALPSPILLRLSLHQLSVPRNLGLSAPLHVQIQVSSRTATQPHIPGSNAAAVLDWLTWAAIIIVDTVVVIAVERVGEAIRIVNTRIGTIVIIGGDETGPSAGAL